MIIMTECEKERVHLPRLFSSKYLINHLYRCLWTLFSSSLFFTFLHFSLVATASPLTYPFLESFKQEPNAVSNQAKNGRNVPADSRLTHALFIQLQEFKPTIQFLLLTTDFCTGSYFSHRGKEFLNLRWVGRKGLRRRLTSDCKSLPFHKIFGRLKKLPPLSCTAIHNIRSCTEYPCCTHLT